MTEQNSAHTHTVLRRRIIRLLNGRTYDQEARNQQRAAHFADKQTTHHTRAVNFRAAQAQARELEQEARERDRQYQAVRQLKLRLKKKKRKK